MKTPKATPKAILLLLLLATATGSAFAHDRFRSRVFIGIGPGYWGPSWYYPPPAYYYPPRVEVVEPPVYIEQGVQSAEPAYWYYCPESRNYYPYVKKCARGWQRVAPTPPDE